MRPNTTKRALSAGKMVVGTMVFETRVPGIASLLAAGGFDFFIVDGEHSPTSLETLQAIALAARGANITCLARVPSRFGSEHLSRPLDIGVEGLMVPQVERVEEVKNIVQATRYYPLGRRGMALGIIHDDYRVSDPLENISSANQEVFIIIQIESKQAIDHLEDLVRVEGIDAALVGPLDLSQSLGVPGQLRHPLVTQYIETMIEKCAQANIPSGVYERNPEDFAYWMKRGVRLLLCTSDIGMIITESKRMVAIVRDIAKGNQVFTF